MTRKTDRIRGRTWGNILRVARAHRGYLKPEYFVNIPGPDWSQNLREMCRWGYLTRIRIGFSTGAGNASSTYRVKPSALKKIAPSTKKVLTES